MRFFLFFFFWLTVSKLLIATVCTHWAQVDQMRSQTVWVSSLSTQTTAMCCFIVITLNRMLHYSSIFLSLFSIFWKYPILNWHPPTIQTCRSRKLMIQNCLEVWWFTCFLSVFVSLGFNCIVSNVFFFVFFIAFPGKWQNEKIPQKVLNNRYSKSNVPWKRQTVWWMTFDERLNHRCHLEFSFVTPQSKLVLTNIGFVSKSYLKVGCVNLPTNGLAKAPYYSAPNLPLLRVSPQG